MHAWKARWLRRLPATKGLEMKNHAITLLVLSLSILPDVASSRGHAEVRAMYGPQIPQTAAGPRPPVAAATRKKKDSVRKAWDDGDKCYRNCMAGGVRGDFCASSCY